MVVSPPFRWVTFYVCTLLLAVFGIKMLYEAWHMSPDEGKEEFEQVSEELKKKENVPMSYIYCNCILYVYGLLRFDLIKVKLNVC